MIVLLLSACSAPDWETLAGDKFQWSDFEGKVVVVNIWAEWCAPCREEIPELNELYQQQAELGLAIFGLHFDRPAPDKLASDADELAIEFPVISVMTSPVITELWPQVLPSTYLYDESGNELAVLVGPQTRESLLAAVEKWQ